MAQRYWTAGGDLAVVCIKQKQCFPEALALPGPDQTFFVAEYLQYGLLGLVL